MALGAAVGGAVMGRRRGAAAFAWGAVLGTLPDLDGLLPMASPVAAFTYHRSYSRRVGLLDGVAPIWPIKRPRFFTKGYYTVVTEGEPVALFRC